MNPITKIAMISCEQTSQLGAKASFKRLSWIEKFRLKMHSNVCVTCQEFAKDSELIDKAVDQILRHRKNQNLTLSEEQHQRILDRVFG